ncbi:hypothetical protein GCM10029964_122600 [Kibdelosporangium lantanae]
MTDRQMTLRNGPLPKEGVVPVARLGPAFPDHVAGPVFQVEEVDTHVGELAELGDDLGDELPGGAHPLDLGGRLQLDHGHPHSVGIIIPP